MARLKDGDRAAFEPVFAASLPLVRHVTRRMLSDDADADDAAQEALLKVFARAGEYDPERDALAWILAIAAYECRTLRKRRARKREVAQERAPETAAEDTPEQQLIRRELHEALADVLGTLAPSDVETIAASIEREQHGVARVAAATLRKRLQRALERLRQRWQQRHGHG